MALILGSLPVSAANVGGPPSPITSSKAPSLSSSSLLTTTFGFGAGFFALGLKLN